MKQDKAEVMAVIETITPKRAAEMLKGNTHNRKASDTHVDRLTGAQLAGDFKLNGETIKVDINGRILDGQKRLLMCIKSGKPFKSVVVYNLPPDVFDTIDIGQARTGAHTLQAAGEVKNAGIMAGGLRFLYDILSGKPDNGDTISNVQLLAGLGEHPRIRNSVSFINSRKMVKNLLMPAAAVALHYLFAKKDEMLAELFFTSLDEGNNLSTTEALYWLRQRLVGNKCNNARLNRVHLAALVIKAWNSTRRAEKCKSLKWQTSEKFPVIV